LVLVEAGLGRLVPVPVPVPVVPGADRCRLLMDDESIKNQRLTIVSLWISNDNRSSLIFVKFIIPSKG
jgi:hypothetical protein